MRRRTLRFGTTAIAVTLAAAAALTAPAHAIENGDAQTPALPWVVKIDINPGSGRVCTGSLINASWVLTAKHCGADGAAYTVTRALRAGQVEAIGRVSQVVAYPDEDIALMKLSSPVPTSSVAAYGKLNPYSAQGPAQVFGYGFMANGSEADRLRSATVSVERVGRLALSAIYHDRVGAYTGWYDYRLHPWATKVVTSSVNGQALPGDSGGPLMQFGGIVGLTSFRSDDNLVDSALISQEVLEWAAKTTSASVGDLSALTATSQQDRVSLRTNSDRWFVSTDATKPALSANEPGPYSLRFDTLNAFQIVDRAGRCLVRKQDLTVALDQVVPETKLANTACDANRIEQKFFFSQIGTTVDGFPSGNIRAVAGGAALTAERESPLSLGKDADAWVIKVTTDGATMPALAKTLQASSSTWTKSTPGATGPLSPPLSYSSPTVHTALPALPSGLRVIDVQLGSQGGNQFAYVLAGDGHVYKSVLHGNDKTFGAWQQLGGDRISDIVVSRTAGGIIYTDGTSIFASYGTQTGSDFGKLPRNARIVKMDFVSTDAGNIVYALGTDSRVYKLREKDGSTWQLAGEGAYDLTASEETDGGVLYATTSGVRYETPKGQQIALPALPAGVKVATLTLSRQTHEFAYVTGDDGRAYKSQLKSGESAFGAWQPQPSGRAASKISVSVRKGAGAVYTDQNDIYVTFGGRQAPLPNGDRPVNVSLATTDDGKDFIYAQGVGGNMYRLQIGTSNWVPLPGRARTFVASTDGLGVLYIAP